MNRPKPKVVILVQARMGSTRLPGKHMKTILGRPLLSYLIERLRRAASADEVVVATTTNPLDDVLEIYCKEHDIACFRGPEEDVLSRFQQAAQHFHAEVIVRITADCPLIDPAVIDRAVDYFFSHQPLDFVSNVVVRTYPRGMDVEVFSEKALQEASLQADQPDEREHVTPYFYRHPEKFRIGSIQLPVDNSAYRWTVDTDKDLQLVARFFEALYPLEKEFTLEDLLNCAKQHPEWMKINENIRQKELKNLASGSYGLEIVRCNEAHARLIFEWRNDPETRRMSFHMEPKVWESFFSAFNEEYFAFPDLPPLFVIEEGQKVAFLRFEPIEHPVNPLRKCCLISINVSPQCRGRGVGVQSLLLAKEFLRFQGYDDAYAEVKKENEASLKAFESAGFSRMPDGEIVVFDTGVRVSISRLIAVLSIKNSYAAKRVFIIAEAGSNWQVGKQKPDYAIAKRMIDAAAEAGADAVKFQVFRPQTIYVPNAGVSHYLADAGIEENIYELFEHIVMPPEMIPQLAEWSRQAGIELMASPFSPQDFAAVDPYVSRHKIASYEIGYQALLELAAKSGKPVIMSTGAANEKEIAWAVETLRRAGAYHLTLMQCTACYPAQPEAMNLRVIPWLKERFRADVGLSDHSLDPLTAPLVAAALGATVIEKHFTLDKNYEGPDHAFALTPLELKQMVEAIRRAEPMLGSGVKYVHETEQELRYFARRGIQAIKDIEAGDVFVEGGNIAILRPGAQTMGIHPQFLKDVVGKSAKRSISLGSGIQWGDY